MRLFAVAACERLRWLFRHDWHRLALDATEEVADAPHRATETRATLRELHRELGAPTHPDNPHLDQAVWCAAFPHEFWEATDALMSRVAWSLEGAWGNRTPPGAGRADVLREVFGNPFDPVVLAPAWLTADVVALARGMYEEKAFDRMPLLADALQDAGCERDDILCHCRGAGPHVRGCWVVDLVLGKEWSWPANQQPDNRDVTETDAPSKYPGTWEPKCVTNTETMRFNTCRAHLMPARPHVAEN